MNLTLTQKYLDEGLDEGKNNPYGAKPNKKKQLYFQNQSCLSTWVSPKNFLILSRPSKNIYKAQKRETKPQTSTSSFFNFKLLQPQISSISNFLILNFSNFKFLQLQSSSTSIFFNFKVLQFQTSLTWNFFNFKLHHLKLPQLQTFSSKSFLV